jgi:hypothetical protein
MPRSIKVTINLHVVSSIRTFELVFITQCLIKEIRCKMCSVISFLGQIALASLRNFRFCSPKRAIFCPLYWLNFFPLHNICCFNYTTQDDSILSPDSSFYSLQICKSRYQVYAFWFAFKIVCFYVASPSAFVLLAFISYFPR